MELLTEQRNEMVGNILKTFRMEVDAVLGLESAFAANATNVSSIGYENSQNYR